MLQKRLERSPLVLNVMLMGSSGSRLCLGESDSSVNGASSEPPESLREAGAGRPESPISMKDTQGETRRKQVYGRGIEPEKPSHIFCIICQKTCHASPLPEFFIFSVFPRLRLLAAASRLSAQVFPKLAAFLCSFITGQQPPRGNYRPKVRLGNNYISFHGRAYETKTGPPARYSRGGRLFYSFDQV